jgi:hypothetical protein
MDSELESIFERADELLQDLENEYQKCLKSQNVTKRAQNLTHEVLDKLRSALDHAMARAWLKYVAPNLSEKNKQRARVYFPITNDLDSLHSTLGRGCMSDLDKTCKNLYIFLLDKQPFSNQENRWLDLLTKIAGEGKHVQLTPQARTETSRISVSGHGGEVSWDPSSVKFGGAGGVSILGAPIDPNTQRIVPTPGVTERVEVWVSFILEGYGVNALGFCKEACQKTKALIEEIVAI